jgi:hypothetical protein
MQQNNSNINLNNTKGFIDTSSIFNLIIAFIGIVGNIISIFIFKQKRMKTNITNSYLLITAIFEFIFSSIIFADYACRFLHSEKYFLHEIHAGLEFVIDILVHIIDSNVGIVTLGLSIDRVKIITNINRSRNFILKKFKISRFVIILSMLITIVEFTSYSLCYNFKYVSTFYLSYCIITKPIVFNVTPIINILAVNFLLIKELSKYFQTNFRERNSLIESISIHRHLTEDELSYRVYRRNKNSEISFVTRNISHKTSNFKNALVIVIMAIWLGLTAIPYSIVNSLFSFVYYNSNENNFDPENIINAQAMTTIFFNSNHSINFFIYIFFDSKFRNCLTKSFKCIQDGMRHFSTSFN